MAQKGHVFGIRSISTVHFTGAAAQNVGLAEGLPIVGAFGASGKCRIVSFQLWSVQNLDWEVWLFNNAYLGGEGGVFNNLLLGLNFDLTGASAGGGNVAAVEGKPGTGISFAGRFKLAATNGLQLAPSSGVAAGPFFYYNDGNDIPYYDEVAPVGVNSATPPKLHVILVNRNATSKNSGAAGAVVLQVNAEPTVGW